VAGQQLNPRLVLGDGAELFGVLGGGAVVDDYELTDPGSART
jgi:hypothetical protein